MGKRSKGEAKPTVIEQVTGLLDQAEPVSRPLWRHAPGSAASLRINHERTRMDTNRVTHRAKGVSRPD